MISDIVFRAFGIVFNFLTFKTIPNQFGHFYPHGCAGTSSLQIARPDTGPTGFFVSDIARTSSALLEVVKNIFGK